MKFTKVIKAEELKKEIPYKELEKLCKKLEKLTDDARSVSKTRGLDTTIDDIDYKSFMESVEEINTNIDMLKTTVKAIFRLAVIKDKESYK